MKTFREWFDAEYYTAIQMRNWETIDYLMDYTEQLERGFNGAVEFIKRSEYPELDYMLME